MRNLYIFMCCALLIGLTSCSDKRQMPNNDIEMGGEGDCGFFYPKIEADIEQTETRTEFNGSGFVLRSKFSEGDQINVLYTNADSSAISSATFTAKVENEQVKFVKNDACTKDVWDNIKKHFKLAYVINDNVEYNESNGSLTLKYEGQSGSLKDLGKYDFVYTNKDDDFYKYFPYIVEETNGSEVLRLHFRHVQNNILHIPLTSEKFVEGAEMSVDLNFLPLGYKNENKYELSGDLFYSKLECDNFVSKDAKPKLTPNSVTLNKDMNTERTVNCFHLSGENLEPKDKRVDLYVVTPASSVVGRMTVQCVLKGDSEGKKLSQSLLLGNLDNEVSESFDRESTILHASADKAFDMDTDNAIGMFLYADKNVGGYAPLTRNTDNVLGIISTNSVASEFPSNKEKNYQTDSEAEYKHYAVGLEIVKIDNDKWWGKKGGNFNDLKDGVRFPDAYVKEEERDFFELESDSKCYLNRNGRLYTEMLRDSVPNIEIVGDDNTLKNCSKPFIPTSGQIYYTIKNLVSVYDASKREFIDKSKDVQCTITPNWSSTIYGKCSYFISWPGLYYNDRIDTFMKSFAGNEKLNKEENKDYIVCSNMNSLNDGGYASFYYFSLYTTTNEDTTTKLNNYTLANFLYIHQNENNAYNFYYIPFYAVK